MKSEYLIKQLAKNPEAVVKLHDRNGEEVLFVLSLSNDNSVIWLETETDVDMTNEIETRFNDANINGTDELDVYMSMLEQGINVEIVRKYLGIEAAEHMTEFCKGHGLIE